MDCQWFKTQHCHSCELLGHNYPETLLLKEKKLKELFANSAATADLKLKKIEALDSADAGQSRNKAKVAVFDNGEGEIEFGFYDSAGHSKKLESCPLHMPGINELFSTLKEKLREYSIPPYSLSEKKGEIKYVIISKSESTEQILLRFILRSKESLDRLKKMAIFLQDIHPEIEVITANIQSEHKAILEGNEEIILTPNKWIEHRFGDVTLKLGARSFFQVTPVIAKKLYEEVGSIIKNKNIQSFLDLYCGVGAFSFFAAKNCPEVMGVEISSEAIICAENSKILNHICGTLDFKALDVELFLRSCKKFEAILINPPRRGLSSTIIKNILLLKPRIIIYSSCNAETLFRDYELLKADFAICETTIFDMFPFTEHFETLMVLEAR